MHAHAFFCMSTSISTRVDTFPKVLTTTDNSLITATDNCMIAHNCNVNAVAILCARIAESAINDFDANDGIAGSNAGA